MIIEITKLQTNLLHIKSCHFADVIARELKQIRTIVQS